MTPRKSAKAAPATRPAPPASPVDDAPWTRYCPDCVPEFWTQGGAWGWAAHRYALHQEGDDPGPCPIGQPPKRKPKGWTEAERAEFHRRRAAAARKARHTPPAPRTPRPTGGHYPGGAGR